jgi:hypothetical protein
MSASWVARIVGVSHGGQQSNFLLSFSFFFFFVVLGFEFRALRLLGRCSTTWGPSPALANNIYKWAYNLKGWRDCRQECILSLDQWPFYNPRADPPAGVSRGRCGPGTLGLSLTALRLWAGRVTCMLPCHPESALATIQAWSCSTPFYFYFFPCFFK